MAKFDYRISVTQPRTLIVGKGLQRAPVSVQDVFTRFVYGAENKQAALVTFSSRPNFKLLRSQGLKLSRSEFLKHPEVVTIERMPKAAK